MKLLAIALIFQAIIFNQVLADDSDESTEKTVEKYKPKPLNREGCYWTECKSPITYDLKCPPSTEEQMERDDEPCGGILIKYQCCPRDKVKDTDQVNIGVESEESSETTTSNVLPEAV